MKLFKPLLLLCALSAQLPGPGSASVQDARAITQDLDEFQTVAEEAYVCAFPMIVAYNVLYDYNVERNSGAFRAPFNQIAREARDYTPKDMAASPRPEPH